MSPRSKVYLSNRIMTSVSYRLDSECSSSLSALPTKREDAMNAGLPCVHRIPRKDPLSDVIWRTCALNQMEASTGQCPHSLTLDFELHGPPPPLKSLVRLPDVRNSFRRAPHLKWFHCQGKVPNLSLRVWDKTIKPLAGPLSRAFILQGEDSSEAGEWRARTSETHTETHLSYINILTSISPGFARTIQGLCTTLILRPYLHCLWKCQRTWYKSVVKQVFLEHAAC